jgi:hypothetical protein
MCGRLLPSRSFWIEIFETPAAVINNAQLTLSQRDDGSVEVEIRTSSPFENYVRRDGLVLEPAEYLQRHSFNVWSSGRPIRYLMVEASGVEEMVLQRYFDLSEGSGERAMVELMVDQESVPVVWVNEGVEVLYTAGQSRRQYWREALENTRGVSAGVWKEEIAELEWRTSASWRPGPRPGRHRRRSAKPPQGIAVPFFARRSGAIPKAKNAEVDGVRLPPGHRQPNGAAAYWISDEPVNNVEILAPWLASRFPETGVWPLLWRTQEQPEDCVDADSDISAIDTVDLLAVLQQRWAQTPPPEDDQPPQFPGLAAPVRGEDPSNPFPEWALAEPTRLLLVPCNRPADAITVLGGVAGESSQQFISAILRSWEERFGAVIFEAAPGFTRISAARHPNDGEQAVALAAEIYACLIDKADLKQTPLSVIAHGLQYGAREQTTDLLDASISSDAWDISW